MHFQFESLFRKHWLEVSILLLALIGVALFAAWLDNSNKIVHRYESKLAIYKNDKVQLNLLFSAYNAFSSSLTYILQKNQSASAYLSKANETLMHLTDLNQFILSQANALEQRGISPPLFIEFLEADKQSILINSQTVNREVASLSQLVSSCNVVVSAVNTKKAALDTEVEKLNTLSSNCTVSTAELAPFCVYDELVQLKKVKQLNSDLLSFIDGKTSLLGECNVNVASDKRAYSKQASDLTKIEEGLPVVRLNRVIKINIAPLPDWADPKFSRVVQDAFDYWQQRVNVSFVPSSDGEVTMQWLKEFGTQALGHVVNTNFIQVGLGDSKCLEKWNQYNYETVKQVVAHELGHVIGFGHSPDPDNVMYASSKTKYDFDFNEAQILAPRFAVFIPVCTQFDSASYNFIVSSDSPVRVGAVPSQAAYNNFVNTNQLTTLEGCASSNSTTNFNAQCIVPTGAGLLVANPSQRATLTAQISIKEN